MVYIEKWRKKKQWKWKTNFRHFHINCVPMIHFAEHASIAIVLCEKEMKEIWSRFSVTYTQLIYSSMLLTFITWVIALQGAIPWFPNSQRNDHQNTFLMKYLDNILPSQCEHEIWFISLFYWDTICLHYNELDKFIVFFLLLLLRTMVIENFY